MSAAPVVSVVVPIGDVDAELVAQLDALSAQTFGAPWELVLVANAPGLAERAELTGAADRFGSTTAVLVVDASAVRSASHARNAGARAASAPLLAFCDADDLVAPDWLAALVDALGRHRLVGGALDEVTLAVPGQERWRPAATPGELPSYLGHPYVVSANLGITRELFEQLGGFDEGLLRGEDMALSFAAIDRGADPAFVPGAVVAYRHRRGLRPLLRQHYLYGWGMSQIIARGGLPGGEAVRAFAANAQPVEHRSWVHVARRGAIALGRLRGLVAERASSRRRAGH